MWEVRTITDDDVDLFRKRVPMGFGEDPSDDEGARQRFTDVFENDRMFAAFDDGDIIGTGGALSFGLTVPGGATVPMAGTTVISVQPTHRRRGVLRALMDSHLDEVTDRHEPLAGLWASESSIYGRFGFGQATRRHNMKLHTTSITMRSPETRGAVRLLEADVAEPLMNSVYNRIRPTIPGMLTRADAWWKVRHIHDGERARGGKSSRRYAVYGDGDSVDGYVTYRQKGKWEDFIAQGEIDVSEVMAATPEAHSSLWSFLTNIDLFTTLEWWNAPVDDPLPEKVTDPRRVRRALEDGLWIRLMDVPSALEARSYEYDGTISVQVVDGTRPENDGVYLLEVVDGRASCDRVNERPDVSCGIDVIGQLYLGWGDGLALAAAGRLDGEPAAVNLIHRLFRTDRPPWCPEVF